jgi:hypothetical protein
LIWYKRASRWVGSLTERGGGGLDWTAQNIRGYRTFWWHTLVVTPGLEF